MNEGGVSSKGYHKWLTLLVSAEVTTRASFGDHGVGEGSGAMVEGRGECVCEG